MTTRRIVRGIMRERIWTHVMEEDIHRYGHPSSSHQTPLQRGVQCVTPVVLVNAVHFVVTRIPSIGGAHTTTKLDDDPTIAPIVPCLYKKVTISPLSTKSYFKSQKILKKVIGQSISRILIHNHISSHATV